MRFAEGIDLLLLVLAVVTVLDCWQPQFPRPVVVDGKLRWGLTCQVLPLVINLFCHSILSYSLFCTGIDPQQGRSNLLPLEVDAAFALGSA
jgi:hypothetical protein